MLHHDEVLGIALDEFEHGPQGAQTEVGTSSLEKAEGTDAASHNAVLTGTWSLPTHTSSAGCVIT